MNDHATEQTLTSDPFREMAAAMRSRNGFDGTILKYTKARWTAGKDAFEMNGRELIALVGDTMFGWCKWENKKPVDYQVGYVRDRYRPPKRKQPGDTDSSKWEKRDTDPWQFTFFLPLIDPEDSNVYIYSTTSRGGRDALASLQEAYADYCEKESTKVPLVILASDSYPHPDFGRVYTPLFEINGWVDPPQNMKPIRPPASSVPALAADVVGVIEHKPNVDGALDDEIPF